MQTRHWLQLCRVSNVPTVVGNVLVGCALNASFSQGFPWLRAAVVSVAIVLLYIAGMALNDVCDAGLDRVERPERPIPSGKITRQQAAIFVALAMVLGLAILSVISFFTLLSGLMLMAMIIAYDTLHKRASWIALLMGVCRGLVYVTAAVAVGWPPAWPEMLSFAVMLTAYVMLLTLVSQAENAEQLAGRAWLSAVILLLALFAPPIRLHGGPWWAIFPAALLAWWMYRACRAVFAKPPQTKRAILTWLSGLCLFDAYILALLGWPWPCAAALVCFLATTRLHRRIMGT
ncbi:MAG: UbiA family prenyltransferase [Planctomycetes bacterium]|nr:UbiA family prenyltransferase [Planctomycetota bacterium]